MGVGWREKTDKPVIKFDRTKYDFFSYWGKGVGLEMLVN